MLSVRFRGSTTEDISTSRPSIKTRSHVQRLNRSPKLTNRPSKIIGLSSTKAFTTKIAPMESVVPNHSFWDIQTLRIRTKSRITSTTVLADTKLRSSKWSHSSWNSPSRQWFPPWWMQQERASPTLKNLSLPSRFRISKTKDSPRLLTLQENFRWVVQRDNIRHLENSNPTSTE